VKRYYQISPHYCNLFHCVTADTQSPHVLQFDPSIENTSSTANVPADALGHWVVHLAAAATLIPAAPVLVEANLLVARREAGVGAGGLPGVRFLDRVCALHARSGGVDAGLQPDYDMVAAKQPLVGIAHGGDAAVSAGCPTACLGRRRD
jgi:hypothetical protein